MLQRSARGTNVDPREKAFANQTWKEREGAGKISQ